MPSFTGARLKKARCRLANSLRARRKVPAYRNRTHRGYVMADIIRFDKYHQIKRQLPGFGTPGFAEAYAEARALLHVAEGNFLTPFETTHVASKLLSPPAVGIFRAIVRRLQHARGVVSFEP